jgi:hypothetical protein
MSESTRAYIYRVLVALAGVLVLHGVIVADDVPVYLTLAEAVLGLGLGLAAKNTSTR